MENVSDAISNQLDSFKNKDTRVTFEVAPSWGKLTKDSIIMMDEQLKLLLYVTMKELEKIKAEEGQDALTWEKLTSVMEQNVMFEKKLNSVDMNVINSKVQKNIRLFGGSGAADPVIHDGIVRWIRECIQDPELLETLGNEAMSNIADIFAQSGASVDSFAHFFANYDDEEFTLLDLGILRTPDITKPHVQLFRVKIYVTRHSKRVLYIQDDTSTISLEANTRDYVPREEVMTNIKENVMQKAVEEMNKLFEKYLV
jgi:hypothetical protein